MNKRERVFISYCHTDEVLLKKLKRHFRSLEDKIDFWEDTKIKAGTLWEEEIKGALTSAKIAILMISADFFNSSYIKDQELPYIIDNASKGELTILTVILKPCLFSLHPEIAKYQAINSPSKTVIEMSESEQEQLWVNLMMRIYELLKQ